jgi:hypothetical protein
VPFSPTFFGDVSFKKKKKKKTIPFELVVGYFKIVQQCKILHNNIVNCKERNTQKTYIYI